MEETRETKVVRLPNVIARADGTIDIAEPAGLTSEQSEAVERGKRLAAAWCGDDQSPAGIRLGEKLRAEL